MKDTCLGQRAESVGREKQKRLDVEMLRRIDERRMYGMVARFVKTIVCFE